MWVIIPFKGYRSVRSSSLADSHKISRLWAKTMPCAVQVALLFLTRDWLPYEPVWRAFLGSVPSMGGNAQQEQQEKEAAWKLLFSLYVHAPPGNKWGWDSIFAGREVANRIKVEWGQWSVVRLPRQALSHISACVTGAC